MIFLKNIISPTIKSIKHCSTTSNCLSVISKQIEALSTININCNYNLKIKPNDILNPDDAKNLRTTLIGVAESDLDTVNIEINQKQVNISSRSVNNNITCIVEIPIQSDLKINSSQNVSLKNLYSDSIKVETQGNVTTKNIKGFTFDVQSEANIFCDGTTLANQINLRTRGKGNIILNKMQGDLLYAICDSGYIRTNSCYTEASKFVSLNGKLLLKNVHKFAEVYLLEGGELDMTGFHGTLLAKTNGGRLKYQLTEIYGDSIIEANNNPESLDIFISDFVEENTEIHVEAGEIILDPRVQHLESCLSGKVLQIEHPNGEMASDKLTVSTLGTLKLGKMSWADTLNLKI